MSDRRQLEETLVALEGQRGVLGDAVVDSSLALVRERLASMNQSVVSQSDQLGERKLVTVMFADISGFTRLSERSDPEQVRALVNACFSWLVPIIEHYGGVVEEFIGDAIMAMFGAPAAHENDAERALRAALDMMEALQGFNSENHTSLGMHIGVNTGVVVAGGLGSRGRQQYGVMGDPVNVASRLEDFSETGQIIVGPNTHRLTASLFDFEMLPPVRLKGKLEPMAVHRLLGIKSAPEPARGIAGLRSPMVGRDSELQMLVDSVAALNARKGGVIALLGEAGLGKSRLVAEVRQATSGCACWAEGRSVSYAEGSSYWIVRSLLDHLIGARPDSAAAELSADLLAFTRRHLVDKAEQAFPYLARLRDVPMSAEFEAVLKDLMPAALQDRMRTSFIDLIRACAGEQALVLVWEDLHWADPSSLGLLESILPLTTDLPLLVVLVFRPDEGRTWDWHQKAVAQLRERYRVIELQPLNQAESARLAENLLTIENMPETVRQLILNKSEGNPFFLEELLRSLIDAGLVLLDGDRAVASQAISQLEVPDTLQGVIAARIDRLRPEDKYTLQTAAVIGRVFQHVVLGFLLQRQNAYVPLDTVLDALQRRELIRRRADLEYIFKHAITHEVAYQSLLIARRRELHRSTAETIEMLFPGQLDELAPTLAHHYAASECHKNAAQYFVRAGDRAGQMYANQEAIAFYRAATAQWKLLGEPEGLAATEERLGDVLSLLGQVDEAVTSYAAALAQTPSEDVVARARLQRLQGNAYNVSRRVEDMLSAYERALTALGKRTDKSTHEWIDLQLDRIWACYFNFGALSGGLPELVTLIEGVRPIVDEHGTPAQRARLLESLVLVDLRRYRYYQLPDETLNNASRQVEAAQAHGNRRAQGRALTIRGFVHLWRDELDLAEKFLTEGLQDVESVGDVETEFIDVNYMALVGRKRGQIAMTREWAERTLALTRKASSPFYQCTGLGSLAWADCRAGDESQARVHLQEALALCTRVPMPIRFMVLGPALLLAAVDQNWRLATEYAKSLLHPSQQKMPDEIESTLREAIQAWEAAKSEAAGKMLLQAIDMMKQASLGYV